MRTRRAWSAVLEQAPDNPGYHHNIAPLLLANGSVASAVRHYRRACQLNPSDSNAKTDLAMVLWRMGKWEASLAALHQVVRMNRVHFEAHLNLSTVYFSKGQLDLAALHARKAAHIRPWNAMAQRSLGCILDQMGNTDESLRHRKIAVCRGPGVSQIFHLQDALTYRKLGAQLVAKGHSQRDNAHTCIDTYRALMGKTVELPHTERTKEILQKHLHGV